MAEHLEKEIQDAQEAVTKQGDTVRSLKASLKDGKAEKAAVDAAIQKLAELKLALEAKQKEFEKATGKVSAQSKEALRAALAGVLERRMFYIPSFKIYGSVAGFYDYGPPGCAIKQNMTQTWRNHFVLEENMLEVECPAVTPEVVLKASGHVDRFTDFMVTDAVTGECFRADHLLEGHLEALLEDKKNPPSPEKVKEIRELLAGVGELKQDTMAAALKEYNVRAPGTGNDISPPFPFNLMFKTSIGPRGDMVGYLRPETAQGIFVNFRDLLYYNGGKLPFAAAQIGNSYRNEISPRAGLLRVREFTQAEIEHFVNGADKSHPKFASVADLKPLLYSRALQMGEEKKAQPMSLGEAVAQGIIANETLAYFIGRTWLFFCKVGINPERMRFRQHLQHEMAHYATDCWDGEVETTYGWVECVGLADRSAYDLKAHSSMSKIDLTAFEKFPEPRLEEVVKVVPNNKELGAVFKKDQKAVKEALEALDKGAAMELKAKLDAGETTKVAGFDIKPGMVDIRKVTEKVAGRTYTPSVIEPSFGIGRIMYCMFEHCYYTREGDETRAVMGFKPLVAPTKATVFPLVQKPALNETASKISRDLTAAGLSNIIDTTGNTIGKRYARTDEIGVPFAVTVDFASVEGDGSVTLRERDSMAQVRVPQGEVAAVIRALVDDRSTWAEVTEKYPAQKATADDE
ncbi:hypothetical protein PLESTB_001261900 [Pleodorina starrii]|uniref:glycine--tRNA ligase n=1 Tax=Pleodorina starrii TaxID=330485 RepID=A0A9W6BSP9_9CHLO|nr:hypothetical protein PLESTM_001074600 [Pleodorina starrii]GLC57761.1 hypothetical protein PLESTB_001261900 [Pleodorina starrii]GLC75938.1 hypothetical protein PLESTF_001708100 [Pleodorina starrii]